MTLTPKPARSSGIDAFLAKKQAEIRVRLIFALDATASRQPTWDMACHIQGQMFDAAARLGTLDVQLVYFRDGAECRASAWVSHPAALASSMRKINCRAGLTQIGRVLTHAVVQAHAAPVQALIFVGDAMEEKIETLLATAADLGALKVPIFMFQEGEEQHAEKAFRRIARVSNGAYFRFNEGAAAQLAELLRAVAVFAVGGVKALEAEGAAGRLLLEQLR
jgi:hypothetical protein